MLKFQFSFFLYYCSWCKINNGDDVLPYGGFVCCISFVFFLNFFHSFPVLSLATDVVSFSWDFPASGCKVKLYQNAMFFMYLKIKCILLYFLVFPLYLSGVLPDFCCFSLAPCVCSVPLDFPTGRSLCLNSYTLTYKK